MSTELGHRVLAIAMLVATDCLSEGVNLQEHFDAVIHYDLSWNPTRHEQREGRVDRYGQPRTIVRTITYYGADNGIDRIVLDVLLRKHARHPPGDRRFGAGPGESDGLVEALMEGVVLRSDFDLEQLTFEGFEDRGRQSSNSSGKTLPRERSDPATCSPNTPSSPRRSSRGRAGARRAWHGERSSARSWSRGASAWRFELRTLVIVSTIDLADSRPRSDRGRHRDRAETFIAERRPPHCGWRGVSDPHPSVRRGASPPKVLDAGIEARPVTGGRPVRHLATTMASLVRRSCSSFATACC